MIKRLCIFAAGAAALVSAALATSCEKDETQEKYVYILDNDKNGIQEVSFNTAGGTQDFLMYSNYGSWKLVPTYEEDLEWLSSGRRRVSATPVSRPWSRRIRRPTSATGH